jgi:hypothetical protein
MDEDPQRLKPSDGDIYDKIPLLMSVPHLDFIYRLQCEMSSENQYVGASFAGSNARVIM